MRVYAVIAAAFLSMAAPAAAQDPVTGTIHSFFGGYQPPQPPISGDCAAIAAAVGADAAWFGRFSGRRLQINDNYEPYAARGCFTSERECRAWQHQALSYAFGRISAMTCRPGIPRAYLP